MTIKRYGYYYPQRDYRRKIYQAENGWFESPRREFAAFASKQRNATSHMDVQYINKLKSGFDLTDLTGGNLWTRTTMFSSAMRALFRPATSRTALSSRAEHHRQMSIRGMPVKEQFKIGRKNER